MTSRSDRHAAAPWGQKMRSELGAETTRLLDRIRRAKGRAILTMQQADNAWARGDALERALLRRQAVALTDELQQLTLGLTLSQRRIADELRVTGRLGVALSAYRRRSERGLPR